MGRRLVLHVGTMKSGTSFLQTLLFEQKEDLAEAGVLVPGKAWGRQATAVRSVLSPGRDRRRVVRRVVRWDGRRGLGGHVAGVARLREPPSRLLPVASCHASHPAARDGRRSVTMDR